MEGAETHARCSGHSGSNFRNIVIHCVVFGEIAVGHDIEDLHDRQMCASYGRMKLRIIVGSVAGYCQNVNVGRFLRL